HKLGHLPALPLNNGVDDQIIISVQLRTEFTVHNENDQKRNEMKMKILCRRRRRVMQQKQHTSNDIKTIGFCNINDNEGEREIYDRQDRKEKTGVKLPPHVAPCGTNAIIELDNVRVAEHNEYVSLHSIAFTTTTSTITIE
ncbi:hypothetical protein BLOT_000362, partial [Blomia tropicalis]